MSDPTRQRRRLTAGLCAAWAVAVGCDDDAQVKRDAADLGDAGVKYADGFLAYTDADGVVQACTDGFGCPPAPSCATHPALGPPDGLTYELRPGGRLEVGLFCGFILDRPGNSPTPDLKIWANVPAGARAVVSASLDGSNYVVVDYLERSDAELDLDRPRLEVARFVRIVHEAGDPIQIDAIEAL